jgi:hypothetical protein
LLFSRRVRRGGLSDVQLAIPYLVFAASFLPFLSASREIWLAVVVYGAQGAWPGGLSRAITVPARWSTGVHTAALVAASAWAIRNGRSEAVPRASLLLLLSTLVFLPGFALQYLVWPIALGSLYPSAGLGLYSLVASLFYCTSAVSLNWPLPVRFDELAVYAAAGLWLTLEAARRRRPRVGPGASRATFG